jgi:hypothetical protein
MPVEMPEPSRPFGPGDLMVTRGSLEWPQVVSRAHLVKDTLVEAIKDKIDRSRNECINHTCSKRERLCARHRGMTEILLLVQSEGVDWK